MDAVWDGRSDGTMMRHVVEYGDQSMGGVIWGANVGCPIMTNGVFVA